MRISGIDIDCILLSRENFEVEIGGDAKTLTRDEIWDILHDSSVVDNDYIEDQIIYIKLENRNIIINL